VIPGLYLMEIITHLYEIEWLDTTKGDKENGDYSLRIN
jgi:hypothetical protein